MKKIVSVLLDAGSSTSDGVDDGLKGRKQDWRKWQGALRAAET